MFYFKIFVVVLILVLSCSADDDPYIPCQSWISFGIDDSNVLRGDDFKMQLNFITNAIGALNHPERIQIVGAYNQSNPWKSGLSIYAIQKFLHTVKQYGPYNLLLQFSEIILNLPKIVPTPFPISALIFISDTSNAALLGASLLMPDLANVRLTFVLLGKGVEENRLQNLSSNFITWKNISQPQPDGWNDFMASNAYGCNPTTLSTATSTRPSTPSVATTLKPYFPCQSWIGFLYDDSISLSANNYETQMSFISSTIGILNYPNRLLLEGGYSSVASWNSHQTVTQMQNELNQVEQTAVPYSLRRQFQMLATNVPLTDGENWPIGALIFISDTSDNALKRADELMPQLANVQLNFVLLGPNADSSKLTNFSSNFISWSDLSKPQPDNWDNSYFAAYGCNGIVTRTPPSTVSTVSSSLAQTGSTLEPYFPCQSWISFSYDDSNTLQNADFKTQMAFISSAIGPLNYPDRLRTDGAYTTTASWKSGQTISQIQTEINNVQQTAITYSLLQEFASLVTGLSVINGTSWPIGALIFISDTSDNALRNAIRFKPQLANVQLTFVLLGPNADSSKLTQFSNNFISWSDLSKPQPDNWNAVATNALGCLNPSSVSFPPPVSTSLPVTSTQGVTSSVATISTTAPILPYFPCQSWISFSYDDSSTLQNNDYKTQMSFISTAIGSINYPDRLRVGGAFTSVASWQSRQTISQMQNELSHLEQTQNSYSLLQQFANILTDQDFNIGNSTQWPIGALIFISDTSDHALQNANVLFPHLTGVKITFVLLGKNVDQTKLTQFSNNFISWPNLSESQPDNWDISYDTAYGCFSESSPTLSPIYPRAADIVFILDDSDCYFTNDISTQRNTILKILSNYTLNIDGVKVAYPHSIGSASFDYTYFTDLSAFVNTALLSCQQLQDANFTIDKALRSSMSFAYQYSRNSPQALIFVVFTLNNGTSVQIGDNGLAFNAAIKYRNECMSPGNVKIVQINPGNGNVNPELGDYFFQYTDPNLLEKFTDSIMAAEIYDKSAIPQSGCIDPLL